MKTQKLNKSEQIIDQIPYFFFLDEEESIVYNKNDTIQKTIKVIYRNLDFADTDTRLLIFDKLNNAIMSLNTENYFSIYFETQRRKVQIREEIKEDVSIPVKKIFTERREQVNTEEDNFVTENYITINYNVSRIHQMKSLWNMIIGKKRKTIEEVINQDFSKFMEEFEEKMTEFLNLIDPVILDYEILKGNRLQGFLYSQVTSEFEDTMEINYDNSLDEYFSYNDFINKGVYSKINDEYVACISFINFPDRVSMRILKDLETLKFGYRYSVRFRVEKQAGLVAKFKNIREYYNVSTRSIGEYATKSYSRYEDDTSREEADETQTAIRELRKRGATFGQLTAAIIIKHKNFKVLQENIKKVIEKTRIQGFHCKNDKYNMFGTYFGAMAGNVELNKRTGLTASTSVLSMIPTSSSFLGYSYNAHLKFPALLSAVTSNNDYYNFNLHVGDTGHFAIMGETGAGKSTLILLIIAAILRMPNARVVLFDKKESSKALCRCMGGEFINIGVDDFSFQIMEKINSKKYREFVRDWLLSIGELEKTEITVEEKNLITRTLELLSTRPIEERTFTNFDNLLPNNKLKTLFYDYIHGSYKKYFNGNYVRKESRFIVYELDTISKNNRLMNLVLSYMFFDMKETMLTGDFLAVILDEAWKAFQIELIENQMDEWMREYRKMNAIFGFATQGLAEVTESNIFNTIITNCRTKIFLANEGAGSQTSRPLYMKMGVEPEEIEKIRTAVPKQQYFVKSRLGSALIDFRIKGTTLDYVGSTSINDRSEIDKIYQKTKNLKEINDLFLEYKKHEKEEKAKSEY